MRTLHADLTAAQKGDTADPVVQVVAENIRGGIRALDFALVDATAQTVASHGVAVAADGSMTRARSDGAGNVMQQRIADPIAGPWSSWNNVGAGKGNLVAVAAKGTRVAIVYVDAAGTGIKIRESTDSGATFAAEAAVLTAAAACVSLAVAYKNTSGDLAIAWATATTLNIIKRTAGTFGGASASGISVNALTGVGMCYGFDYDLILTGTEVTTLRRTLWTIVYGDGTDAAVGTWGSLLVQQQAEADSSVAYSAPFVAYTDTYHMRYVEADTFTGGNTRTFRTSLHPASSFVLGAYTVRAPIPTDYTGTHGLAIAAGTTYVYETAANTLRAASRAQVQTTLTNDVLALEIAAREHATTR